MGIGSWVGVAVGVGDAIGGTAEGEVADLDAWEGMPAPGAVAHEASRMAIPRESWIRGAICRC